MVLHVAEKYVRIVEDMNDDSITAVTCCRSDGGVRGEGGTAQRIGFEPLFVCNDDG